MTYRQIRRRWQHTFGWDSVLVDGWAMLWSPFVTRLALSLKLIPNAITLLMIASGILGGVLFALPPIWCKILGALFIHLWYVFDCSDGEVARITKRFSRFGTEIDYTAHVLDHPVILLGFYFALRQADTGIEPLVILMTVAVVAVLDLIFRSMATFGLIRELKCPTPPTEGTPTVTLRQKIRFFINIPVHLPNLALIFPIVYFICPQAAFWYLTAVGICLALYVPVVVLAWLKGIVKQ